MGLIATLLKMTRAKFAVKGNAPGKSTLVQGEGMDGQTVSAEIYHLPGVASLPGDNTRGIWIPVGGSKRSGVVIACHNYQIEIDVGGQGGIAIFSTDAAGATVKSKIVLKPDGTIEMNGNSKRFVTWDELNTALQNHTHAAGTLVAPNGPVTGATGAPVALNIESAKTTTLKTGG